MTSLLLLLLGVVSAVPADLTPAWDALRAGEVAAARAAFAEALLVSPEQVEALNGMGFTALRDGKTEDAGRYFARARARSASDRDALVGQALVDERTGALEVALARIEAVLESHPADEEATALREHLEARLPPRPGAEFRQRRPGLPDLVHGAWVELPDHHDFADLDFRQSSRSENQRVVDLLHGATILGREWEPLRLYQWKTWDEPTHPSFGKLSCRIVRTSLRSGVPYGSAAWRLNEARAAQEAGRLEEGIRLYRGLIDDPDPTVQGTALLGLALLESRRADYGDAVTHYRMVRDRFPERRKDAIYGAARTLGWGRHYSEALAELDQNLEDYPDDKAQLVLEAQVAGWGGLMDRSMAASRRALEIDPQDLEAQLVMAKVLSWSGRLPESEVEFKEFLSQHPDDETGLMGMTYTLMWQGRPHEAETWFGRIGRESEGSKDYRITETALYWALGERALAREHLRELMWQFPGEPDTRDLWRAQTGVVGPFARTEPTVMRDVEGLRVETLRLDAAAPLAAPGFVFAQGRQEWLEQNGDALGVKGGQIGVDWVFDRRWRARGSVGARRSDVDTGGWTGGAGVSTILRPDRGFSASVDSDFAFYSPVAVRSDVRMTGLTLAAWTALTSRLSVSGAYSRTHFAASEESPRPEVDQNRDALTVKARHYLLGYQTNRVDVGALGYFFRFDRSFDTGYWNPERFRQVMGTVAATHHRGGELWTFIVEGGLGVQSQDDQPWGPAVSVHGEFLHQFQRRVDLTGRVSYGNSGFAHQTGATGYWNWSAALGVQVRVGNRNLRGPVEVREDTTSTAAAR